VDPGPHPRSVAEADVDGLGEFEPATELLRTRGRIVDLDEQRRAELARPAEELVVGVELVLDVALADDALDPHHLLHLVADGEPVLEEERQVLADVYTPRRLRSEHARTEDLPLVLVGDVIDDLAALDRTRHHASSSATAATGLAKPFARYARARIDIGW